MMGRQTKWNWKGTGVAVRRAATRSSAHLYAGPAHHSSALRLAILALCLVATTPHRSASAYSYAEAGAEPLIEARERTLAAFAKDDFATVKQAAEDAAAELRYLDEAFDLSLAERLSRAIEARDEAAISRVYLEGFRAEIRRRLIAAGENLTDYQLAKTLVVKSKLFFDLLAPELAEEPRTRANTALRACLEAIGNPGVFGVGARPPDPEAYARNLAIVLESLDTL